MRTLFPLGALKKIDKVKSVMQANLVDPEIGNQKIKFIIEQYNTVSNVDNMLEAQRGAAEIMDMCNEWLQESKHLLSEEETMADVLAMNMLTRLELNHRWFDVNVLSKPKLRAYWESHK